MDLFNPLVKSYYKNRFGGGGSGSSGGGDNAGGDNAGGDAELALIERAVAGHYENERVTKVGDYAFYYCQGLTSVRLPAATLVKGFSFYNCLNLTSIDLPSVARIENYAFYSCPKLTAAILRNNEPSYFAGGDIFSNTPIASGTGYIYVPSSTVDSYKNRTNSSRYAAQFRALEDYTIDGTTTGELDPDKI